MADVVGLHRPAEQEVQDTLQNVLDAIDQLGSGGLVAVVYTDGEDSVRVSYLGQRLELLGAVEVLRAAVLAEE